ncbi:hypothetical protein HB774_25125 (plasmid) [Rhizobium leguminosarum bv. viciae]|nr:hypothetical protein HB774_25125 [Rhizobium leguminosarum bv. viciae]
MALALLSTPSQSTAGQSAAARDESARYGLIFHRPSTPQTSTTSVRWVSVKERKRVGATLDGLASSNKPGVLKWPLLRGRSLYKPSCADTDLVRDWRNYTKIGYLREKWVAQLLGPPEINQLP